MKQANNKTKRSTGPSLIRMISVLFGVIIATVPFHMFAKQTANDTSLNGILLSFASGIIAASLLATIVEWTVHRFAMHRGKRFPLFRIATELHHKAHHWVHYTPNKYIATKPLNRPSVLAKDKTELCESKFVIMLTTLSHGAFYTFLTVPILVTAWKITFNFWFTAAMVFAASIFIYLFIRVHDAVHHPGLSFLENFKWFWFLDKHHYIHHIDNNVNTNFLLPLTDLLMGTLRQNMTLEEKKMWPSYTETRQA